jgi:serine/threonine protein kinase
MSAIVSSLTISSSDVENPSNSCEPRTTTTPYKSADTFKGLCPDELIDFVQMFCTYNAAESYLLSTFFPDDWSKEEHTLYSNVNSAEQFVCNVFTFGDSPFVVKQIIDLSPKCENGKLRWFPELINHKLAEVILPEHVLTLHAACVNRAFTHFYFVYDRAERLSPSNLHEHYDEMFAVVSALNRHGLLHLDTKPSNFLTRDGRIYIHDFGIALPMEMHTCPGSIVFSDPFHADRDLWEAVKSLSFGASPFETIRDWSVQCQTRMLYAQIPDKFVPRADVPTHAVGLGTDGLYTSPPWFDEMFTILNSFSTYSVLRSWKDFRAKLSC